MSLRLCVQLLSSFSWLVRIIFPRISLHDLPCHGTKKILCSRQVSLRLQVLVIFHFLQEKSLTHTYFCNYPQYPCLFGILFECDPNTHGQGMMLVLPNQRLSQGFAKSD